MKIIKIKDHVSLNQGVSPEEGRPINDLIKESFKDHEPITLDFYGMELTTTAFLNVVIGSLYGEFPISIIKELLSFDHIDEGMARRIKKVTDNAKEYYKDPEKFQENVDSVMYGKD